MILKPWYGACLIIYIMSLYILLFTLYPFYFPDQYSHCNSTFSLLTFTLLARQAQMTSPLYKAKELWIAHDPTRL